MSVLVTRFGGMTATPDVIQRYYRAAASDELDALLSCFAADAHVLDEQQHFHGVAEIRRWREGLASRFTYTTEITATRREGDDVHVVSTHLEGDFPGGVVDLEQRFTLRDELIVDLSI